MRAGLSPSQVLYLDETVSGDTLNDVKALLTMS